MNQMQSVLFMIKIFDIDKTMSYGLKGNKIKG